MVNLNDFFSWLCIAPITNKRNIVSISSYKYHLVTGTILHGATVLIPHVEKKNCWIVPIFKKFNNFKICNNDIEF